jgi:hypothetical protein
MARVLAFLIIVVCCLAQRGDAALEPLRIKALICERGGVGDRDVCGKRTAKQAFEPARIRLEVYFAPHPDNRSIRYGLLCAGEDDPRAESGPYDVLPTDFLLFVEHPNIAAGDCFGVAVLGRANEPPIWAKDGPLRILSRE